MGETLNQTRANTAHSYLPIMYDRHLFVMSFLPTTKREEKSQPIGHPLYLYMRNSMSSIWSLESSSSPLHRKRTEKELCHQNVQYIFMILHSVTSHQHIVSLLKGLTSLVLPMFSMSQWRLLCLSALAQLSPGLVQGTADLFQTKTSFHQQLDILRNIDPTLKQEKQEKMG